MTGGQFFELLRQFLLSGVGTLCFGVLFGIPRKCYLACAATGAVGWLTYELAVMLGIGAVTANLLAVIPLTLLARLFAIGLKAPVTVFLLCGIFPLVPGAGIYYTAYYFIQNDNVQMAASRWCWGCRCPGTRARKSLDKSPGRGYNKHDITTLAVKRRVSPRIDLYQRAWQVRAGGEQGAENGLGAARARGKSRKPATGAPVTASGCKRGLPAAALRPRPARGRRTKVVPRKHCSSRPCRFLHLWGRGLFHFRPHTKFSV